jgi:isoleucyl-tRNA synthetase
MAPILPATADDLWRHIPGASARSSSVHLEDFPKVDGLVDRAVLDTWQRLLDVRQQVNAALEQKRKDKVIGTALGARVELRASGPVATLLDRYRADLPMLLNVSEVSLEAAPPTAEDVVQVVVQKASGDKCARCWRFVPRLRTEPEWAGICDRCVDALEPVAR